jgi:hypothetical protein
MSDQRRWTSCLSFRHRQTEANPRVVEDLPMPLLTLHEQLDRARSPLHLEVYRCLPVVPLSSASVNPIQGYEAMHMIGKGQIRWLQNGDIAGQLRFVNRAFGLAA